MADQWNQAAHPRGQAGLFSEKDYRDPGVDILGRAPLRQPLTDEDVAELRQLTARRGRS